MIRDYVKADRLYPWMVVILLASAIAVTHRQTVMYLSLAVEDESLFWLIGSYLGSALACMGLATLVWRICFALRYRPYAPVPESLLPSVTVVIPAYNEGPQILATVQSVMASRYPLHKLRVICVDDGSRDDTWHWMKLAHKAFPKRVRLIRQPRNGGKRKALLAGFDRAGGQVLVTIDSDSEVLPDTLHHLVSPLVADKRVGSVAGNVRVLNVTEGAIPKMMEVSFVSAFDFIRTGQSVYGGVFCTPGALSAYRAEVIKPLLAEWENQTFLGRPATIGEDRALTNLVLAAGYRVVYQRDAVVLTKVPVRYSGLRRMLLRWARSNVRENLVMFAFMLGRFRTGDSGSGWIRLFSFTQIVRMTVTESLKLAIIVQLVLAPAATLAALALGAMLSSILPAVVHQFRYGGWFGWRWAVPFSFFWLAALSWIPMWGFFTAANSGWLTRGAAGSDRSKQRRPVVALPKPGSKAFSKAA